MQSQNASWCHLRLSSYHMYDLSIGEVRKNHKCFENAERGKGGCHPSKKFQIPMVYRKYCNCDFSTMLQSHVLAT